TPETVPEEIEVTCVASSLVNHVNEDPPNVHRSDPERWHSCNLTQRVAPAERGAASFARRRVQLDDAVDAVIGGEPHCLVWIVGPGRVPGWGHLHTEQSALEPAVLGPSQ